MAFVGSNKENASRVIMSIKLYQVQIYQYHFNHGDHSASYVTIKDILAIANNMGLKAIGLLTDRVRREHPIGC